jgi:hypothetical protein
MKPGGIAEALSTLATKAHLVALKAATKADFAALRSELKAGIEILKRDMTIRLDSMMIVASASFSPASN